MRFWDASAIIPLCLVEPQTARVKELAEEDGEIVVWWSTPIECCSAFARLRREGIVSRTGEDQARRSLVSLAGAWTEIQPGTVIRESAVRALLFHPIRAADALQLSAALVWVGGHPTTHEFVCFDHRLRDAASREGFIVLPEVA